MDKYPTMAQRAKLPTIDEIPPEDLNSWGYPRRPTFVLKKNGNRKTPEEVKTPGWRFRGWVKDAARWEWCE